LKTYSRGSLKIEDPATQIKKMRKEKKNVELLQIFISISNFQEIKALSKAKKVRTGWFVQVS